MSAYLCFLGPGETSHGICSTIVDKINDYSCVKTNNMKFFKYFGEVTHDFSNDDLHALDYWVVKKDVVSTFIDLYEEELQDDSFYEYPRLVGGLFERQPEENNVRLALHAQFH